MFTIIILLAILVLMILVAKQVNLVQYLVMLVEMREMERDIYSDENYAIRDMRLFNEQFQGKVVGYRPPKLYINEGLNEYVIRF